MLFNSLSFALFLPVVYAAYLMLPHRGQNLLLLAASYVFYGSWDWRFLSLILFSTGVDYWVGSRLGTVSDAGMRRRLLLVSVLANLGLLGLFKYFDFFAQSLQDLLSAAGLHVGVATLDVILPVGISFYTFQTLSYTIDVYRGRLEPERDPVSFALFVAFFPQLVAGPIERARRMLPQIRTPRRLTERDITTGLWYMLLGYCLKSFVADNLAPIVDTGFSEQGLRDGWAALLGVYAFAFQIFGDFAGYSWIAIGVARLMGFRLTTNFLAPYLVTNPREFWRNWHISLSTWLRDYLYIPLGGNRGGRWRVYRNLSLTMILGGLWHGAAWTFVLWGVFHGALLVSHRLLQEVAGLSKPVLQAGIQAPWTVLKVVGMFHVTCVGWLIFRASSMSELTGLATSILSGLGPLHQPHIVTMLQIAFFGSVAMGIQVFVVRRRGRTDLGALPRLARVALPAALFYALLIWGRFGGEPFIYFQF